MSISPPPLSSCGIYEKGSTIYTIPSGLKVIVSNYNNVLPIYPGGYSFTATIDDPVYTGIAYSYMIITKAEAQLAVTNLSQTYNGTPEGASTYTSPAGLQVLLTYNGSTNLPVDAGSYAVNAFIDDTNYYGSVTNVLLINQAYATVNIADLSQTYTGSPQTAFVTTVPSNLTVNLTYNGSSNAPVNAGSYTVVATVDDTNYEGSSTNTLLISQATASVALNSLSQTYDGFPEPVGVTTVPSGLNVAITYNGGFSPPTNAGSYLVAGTVVDPNYQGSDVETLVISQATASLTFSNLSQTYDGTTKNVCALTVPSNLLVNVTYNGDTNAPTNAGSYFVSGSIADPNYQGTTTNTLVINQATAGISFTNLLQVFSGGPESVSVSTAPPGLSVNVIYNGCTNAPTNTGNYTVVATVVDTNYQGTATNVFLIVPPATTPISVASAATLANGTFQLSFTNTPGASFSVLASPDPSVPLSNWPVAGSVVEVSPGQFEFTDLNATNFPQQFYIVRSP